MIAWIRPLSTNELPGICMSGTNDEPTFSKRVFLPQKKLRRSLAGASRMTVRR
jgi:hypothetical protein